MTARRKTTKKLARPTDAERAKWGRVIVSYQCLLEVYTNQPDNAQELANQGTADALNEFVSKTPFQLLDYRLQFSQWVVHVDEGGEWRVYKEVWVLK